MENKERVEEFLKEVFRLSEKHGISINTTELLYLSDIKSETELANFVGFYHDDEKKIVYSSPDLHEHIEISL
jgi:hypothetical protein